MEEEEAEDINYFDDEKEEEDDFEDEENQSFLVPDGYFSADELSEKESNTIISLIIYYHIYNI